MIDRQEISFQFHFDPMNNDGCYLDEVADVSEEVHENLIKALRKSTKAVTHIDSNFNVTRMPVDSEYYG